MLNFDNIARRSVPDSPGSSAAFRARVRAGSAVHAPGPRGQAGARPTRGPPRPGSTRRASSERRGQARHHGRKPGGAHEPADARDAVHGACGGAIMYRVLSGVTSDRNNFPMILRSLAQGADDGQSALPAPP